MADKWSGTKRTIASMKAKKLTNCSFIMFLVAFLGGMVAFRSADPVHKPARYSTSQRIATLVDTPALPPNASIPDLSSPASIAELQLQLTQQAPTDLPSVASASIATASTSAPAAPAAAPAAAPSPEKLQIGEALRQKDISIELFASKDLGVVVCRIYNVCRAASGTLTIQNSTPYVRSLAIEHCHGRKGYFSKDQQDQPPVPGDEHIKQIDGDLLVAGMGDKFTTVRYHMPHALSDLVNVLAGWDLVQRIYERVLRLGTTHGPIDGWKQYTGDRELPSARVNGVKGVAIFENKLSLAGWIPSLLSIIPMYQRSILLRDLVDYRHVCFRSAIIATPRLGRSQPQTIFFSPNRSDSPFAMTNSLQRQLPTTRGRPCNLKVLVIDRIRGDGRSISNLEQVTAAIERIPDASISVSVAYFVKASFAQQVKAMQTADIIVSIHGAELTNLLFARAGTAVFEICPFAYCPGPFDGFADIFGLTFKKHITKAEIAQFESCMLRRNLKNRAAADRVIDEFTRNAKDPKQAAGYSLEGADRYGSHDQRLCARSQNLEISVPRLVADITERCRAMCPV